MSQADTEKLSLEWNEKFATFEKEFTEHTLELVKESVKAALVEVTASNLGDLPSSTAWYRNLAGNSHSQLSGLRVPHRPGGARGPGTFLESPSSTDITDPASGNINDSQSARVDYQAEFAVLKDSLSRFKLPVEVKFAPNAVGLKREDKGAYNIVKNTAAYVECNLKILSLLQAKEYSPDSAVNDLSVINTALMKSLKEEHATLLVQGKFNKDTASMFKNLRKEGNSFSQDTLETLQLAANLTQYNHAGGDRPSRPDNYRNRFRGRGRGYSNFNNRGQFNQRDTYSRLADQHIPERRPGQGNFSDEN